MTFAGNTPLKKAISRWAVSYALVAVYLYYHSGVPVGSVLLAGAGTLAIVVGGVWWRTRA